MAMIDAKHIEHEYHRLAAALHRWEADPSPEMERTLQTTATQTQAQLDARKSAGAWEDVQVKLLHDTVEHVGAQLEMARQEAARGY